MTRPRRAAVAIALFTADLRLHDNPVLRAALAGADRVVPLFVLDSGIAATGFAVPNRAAFLAECLADLDAALRIRGGRLVLRTGEVVEETCRVAAETGAERVHLAGGVSRYAQRRERRLRAALAGERRELRVHDGVTTVLAPGAVAPAGKHHFAVFTPYFRRWQAEGVPAALGPPRTVTVPEEARSAPLPSAAVRGTAPGRPLGGESRARARLRAWCASGLDRYADRQDDLAADATSRLSPYLHFGCLSPAEPVRRARAAGGPGAAAFERQLAWRDFHHQVLAARPDAAVRDLRTRHDRWLPDGEEARAWRAGRTGYPLVDAAMRQLLHEGWMHNRARLLTASFLAKTLYVDWRIGADHFLAHLVDGDVADNQLNWQWVAGTGTDTRPNRVLNPLAQAKRFDPDGTYVRRWVPELARVPGAAVHRPWLLPGPDRAALDYPEPLVDLAEATTRFRRARGL
ncbi:cryptochrome/photolyase family protein [Streptomyces sp. URMC 123]|uniref:cryptochrome/photolyase family protein n=1 Tax=Streptomyces sp. URMC 123 TaxID=3423403 RepID=UPI003F1C45E9